MVIASNRTAASPFRLAVAGTTVATEPCSAGPCSVEPCSAIPFPATEAASEARLASSSAVETECLCQSSAKPAESPAEKPMATWRDLPYHQRAIWALFANFHKARVPSYSDRAQKCTRTLHPDVGFSVRPPPPQTGVNTAPGVRGLRVGF